MKKSFLFLSLMAAVLLTSCGAPVQPEQISVNPNPLTVVGNKVNAHITGTFPRKKFAKNAVLVVTPVLKFNGKEVLGFFRGPTMISRVLISMPLFRKSQMRPDNRRQ